MLNNGDRSQKHSSKWMRDSKGYLLYNSIYGNQRKGNTGDRRRQVDAVSDDGWDGEDYKRAKEEIFWGTEFFCLDCGGNTQLHVSVKNRTMCPKG